jgi:hypothetical protein
LSAVRRRSRSSRCSCRMIGAPLMVTSIKCKPPVFVDIVDDLFLLVGGRELNLQNTVSGSCKNTSKQLNQCSWITNCTFILRILSVNLWLNSKTPFGEIVLFFWLFDENLVLSTWEWMKHAYSNIFRKI